MERDRFRKWAERIGINTYTAVNAILTSKGVEQQTYRSCMGLLKLAEKYSDALLEAACKKALSYTASPSHKGIKNILVTSSDKHRCFNYCASVKNEVQADMCLFFIR